MPYGITNNGQLISEPRAVAIIQEALERGVRWIDTASAYGEAEKRVGLALREYQGHGVRLVTKWKPSHAFTHDNPLSIARQSFDQSIESSLRALNAERLDVLMLHGWTQYGEAQGALREWLLEGQESGRIRELGASVYEPAEAIAAMTFPEIKHIQIPFNLLDSRWLSGSFIRAMNKRPDVTFHARSVLLQGLLLNDGAAWPSWCKDRFNYTAQLSNLVAELERESAADLCIAFVAAHRWIGQIIVGLISKIQLEENLRLFDRKTLTAEEINYVRAAFKEVPERLIDPRQW